MRFFVKTGVVIFGMHTDDEFYRKNESQPSLAYPFRYLSDFLSLLTLIHFS